MKYWLICLGLLVASVRSAPLESNPVTLVDDIVPLNDVHPGYAATEQVYQLVSISPQALEDSLKNCQLEAISEDIKRLEELYGTPFERNVYRLSNMSVRPDQEIPWPGSYWPTARDGINYRWNQSDMSASEKYARAYGLDVTNFQADISSKSGILKQTERGRKACRTDDDCTDLFDESACSRREGTPEQEQGVCIPGWFGLCHAWAPASLLEKEPICPVTKNGITFEPLDIKALLTQVYDEASIKTVFTGSRFSGKDDPKAIDKYGRYTDASRRDLGPGFFHLAITNIMGRFQKPLIIDKVSGSPVWNQPAYKYEILNQVLYTPEEAATKFFRGETKYVFNEKAVKIMYIKNSFKWIDESGDVNVPFVSTGRYEEFSGGSIYEYVLELDQEDNIIGGEWILYAKLQHPDFLWAPVGPPAKNFIGSSGLSYKSVQKLLAASLTSTC